MSEIVMSQGQAIAVGAGTVIPLAATPILARYLKFTVIGTVYGLGDKNVSNANVPQLADGYEIYADFPEGGLDEFDLSKIYIYCVNIGDGVKYSYVKG
jgi:hypothetical protein